MARGAAQAAAEQLDDILRGSRNAACSAAARRCSAAISAIPAWRTWWRAPSRRCGARPPKALYLCDPVIGDDGLGVFVSPGVPEAIRERFLPLADIVLPIASSPQLTGRPVRSLEDVRAAAADLRARGPRLVVVTGLNLPERLGELAVLADAAEEAWLVTTQPPLSIGGGTGRRVSALFLGHYLNAGELRAGLERAVAAMFALVERARPTAGAEELELVAAQDELVDPGRRFPRSASASGRNPTDTRPGIPAAIDKAAACGPQADFGPGRIPLHRVGKLFAFEELQRGRVELVGLLPHGKMARILHDDELRPGNQLRHLRRVRGRDALIVVANKITVGTRMPRSWSLV